MSWRQLASHAVELTLDFRLSIMVATKGPSWTACVGAVGTGPPCGEAQRTFDTEIINAFLTGSCYSVTLNVFLSLLI